MAASMKQVGMVTFAVFMTEALIHYNVGISAATKQKFTFKIPEVKELVSLGLIVGTASLVSTTIIDRIGG
mgnify:FL=1|jgi:hypothetical protein|tara:strand:- start:903 stop:1112 length:210 start_codon:yes stop_codon:yes gene_type:complete